MTHVERITPTRITSMLKLILYDYINVYILLSGAITVENRGTAANSNNRKNIIIKYFTPFTDYISDLNNTEIDNARDIDVVMLMYNLIEYSANYPKTSGSLWKYYRNGLCLIDNGAIADFPVDNNNSALFKLKTKIVGRIVNNGTKDVKIMVPLKYLSNFWGTLEMPLTNCEINITLTWSANFFIIDDPISNQIPTFTTTDSKLYAPVVTISTQDNAKLLQQLKSGFKRTLNWNKHQSKVTVQK